MSGGIVYRCEKYELILGRRKVGKFEKGVQKNAVSVLDVSVSVIW